MNCRCDNYAIKMLAKSPRTLGSGPGAYGLPSLPRMRPLGSFPGAPVDAAPLAADADVSPALARDSPLPSDISASLKAVSCNSSARARRSRRTLDFRETVFSCGKKQRNLSAF